METAILLSPEQVAQILGIGRTFVFALIANGRLKSLKLGRRRLIPRDEVEAFIDSERERQAAENEGEAMSQGWPTNPERPKDSGTPQ
jgi:excisionase family DNA binding protein